MVVDELTSRTYPVAEDMPLQRRFWFWERIGWSLFFIVVICTLLGLFSHGPLSSRSVSSADGLLRVEYERFMRNGAVLTMTITGTAIADGASAQQGPAAAVVALEGKMAEAFTIETIQPQPIAARTRGNGQSFDINPDSEGRLVVRLAVKADGFGPVTGTVTLNGRSRITLRQWIYP